VEDSLAPSLDTQQYDEYAQDIQDKTGFDLQETTQVQTTQVKITQVKKHC